MPHQNPDTPQKESNWQPYASGAAAAVFFFFYENYKHLIISRLEETSYTLTTNILMSAVVGILFGFYVHFRRKRLKAKR